MFCPTGTVYVESAVFHAEGATVRASRSFGPPAANTMVVPLKASRMLALPRFHVLVDHVEP